MTEEREVVREVALRDDYAYHVRSAVRLAQVASAFDSDVSVSRDGSQVDAKSAIQLTMLAGEKGRQFTVRAQGVDAEEAVEAVAKLFAESFGEEQ